MGNDVLDPETALPLFHVLLYCMACIFGGGALIALFIYAVLVGSEMLLEPGSKPKSAKAPQLVRSGHAAEETLDPSAATPILSVPDVPEQTEVTVNTSSLREQTPIFAPVTLEAEPRGSGRQPRDYGIGVN